MRKIKGTLFYVSSNTLKHSPTVGSRSHAFYLTLKCKTLITHGSPNLHACIIFYADDFKGDIKRYVLAYKNGFNMQNGLYERYWLQ